MADETTKKRSLGQNVKSVAVLAVAILALIIIWRNRQQVETDLIVFTTSIPYFLALLGSLAVGFLLGTFFGKRVLFGRRR